MPPQIVEIIERATTTEALDPADRTDLAVARLWSDQCGGRREVMVEHIARQVAALILMDARGWA